QVLAGEGNPFSAAAVLQGMQRAARLVGMHFFNPVPLMKLVEVVSGLQTEAAVAEAIFALSQAWGKVAVHARSTPGFIVNRIARPYYAETLALLQEQVAKPAVLDACLRGAGFRMGPCELMDLIGHDTNFAVTQSVYEANFFDKRYMPSLVQREMVDGGLLGRKSGQGFYSYAPDAAKPAIAPCATLPAPTARSVWLHGRGPLADALFAACERAVRLERLPDTGTPPALQRDESSAWIGLEIDGKHLRMTDGRCATQLGSDVAVFDLPLQSTAGTVLAWAPSSGATAAWATQAAQWLQALGFNPQRVSDSPALVVARSIAMLVNEAADAVHQGVCSQAAADAAMKLGVNYPAGPFEWLAQWGALPVCHLLDALNAFYRGERYRVSPLLRQLSWQD
ncbi:MAG: 3-hydroxyacyl-CoA dehydrogenase, partial [Rhodoferax sp.]|nr:3-hydroxyacyl-CoA dehydrogenase [Rhodoferax sp.]